MSAVAVRVRLFAALRERFGRDAFELELPDADRPALERALDEVLGPGSAASLFAPPNRVARNRELVQGDGLRLSPGDEIAFLPPVTGG